MQCLLPLKLVFQFPGSLLQPGVLGLAIPPYFGLLRYTQANLFVRLPDLRLDLLLLLLSIVRLQGRCFHWPQVALILGRPLLHQDLFLVQFPIDLRLLGLARILVIGLQRPKGAQPVDLLPIVSFHLLC